MHARSRAPAWSCFLQQRLLEENLLQLFMELIILVVKLKNFIILVMVRSNLIIAGSNFIFSHIKENYSKYLNIKKNF